MSELTTHTDILPDDAWVENRRCSSGESWIFFPELKGNTQMAKAICAQCAVVEPCLQFALENNEKFGVFGGMTAEERRRLLVRSQVVAIRPKADIIQLVPRPAEDEEAA